MKKVDLEILRVYLGELINSMSLDELCDYCYDFREILKLVDRKIENYDKQD